MRGKHTAKDRRIFTSSGYKIAVGVVIALAVALVALLLVFLPALDEEVKTQRTIVSIENTYGDIGVGSDLSKVYVTVTYSDGTVENVSVASMTHEGLDVSYAGAQNLSLSFGGFEQVIPVKVVNVNCELRYNASVGGRIRGEVVQSVINGGDAASVVAEPETGYVFEKWNDGFPYPSRKDYGVTENKTYIAIFAKAQYTVRFYYDDGTVASEEKVTYGEAPTKVPHTVDDLKMKKYGYTFSNWVPMDFSVIDRNMTMYPEYIKTATDVMVSVPNDQFGASMGETNVRSEGYYAHNSYATITATPFNSREFAYWLIETSSGEYKKVPRNNGNETYQIGTNNFEVNFQSTNSGATKADFVLSFYARAEIMQVKIKAIFAYSESSVTFVNYQNPLNNNIEMYITGLPFNVQLKEYETDTLSFKEGIPEPNKVVGMQFLGWFRAEDPLQTVVNNEITFEQPARLIAKWRKLEYEIIFNYTDSGGNTKPWHSTKVVYQDTFASGTDGGLPLSNPTLDNYIFVGWEDSLTHKPVDDKTKLYVQPEYVGNTDFNNQKLYMTPVWTPVAHQLFVKIDGSGKVVMLINEGKTDTNGNSLAQRVDDIRGTYTIYETNSYTLYFEALTGFELKSLRWSYSSTVVTDNFDVDGLNNKIIYVNQDFDNDVLVSFSSIKYSVDITNGTGLYSGLVKSNSSVFDDSQVTLVVEYNSALELFVESNNGLYAISDIIINGRANGEQLTNYSLSSYLDDDTLSYTIVLEKCLSNITIEIAYAAREYSVNVANFSGGQIVQSDFYNLDSATPVGAQTSFTYGQKVVYKITATDSVSARKYLSSIRINGSQFDLYTAMHDSVRFFNWQNNKVSQGITAMSIGDDYYYSYGDFTYNTDNYMYCEGMYGRSSYIFVHSTSEQGNILLPVDVSVEGYDAILSAAKTALDIENRSVYSTQVKKDDRITTVYLMLTITENFNLSIGFSDISYKVAVDLDERGTSVVSNATPSFKQSSTVTITPITGYYIAGFVKGDGLFEKVTTAKKGDSFSRTFTDITEDINLTIVYEAITFDVSFVNHSSAEADAFVGGNLLNNTYSYQLEYHSSQTFTVNINTIGKRISVLTINDVIQPVHYNMTTYTFVINNIKESININIWCEDKTESNQGEIPKYSFNIESEYALNTTVSVQYSTCNISEQNWVRIIADKGYTISTVSISGNDGTGGYKVLPFDQLNKGKTLVDITIPADYFAEGTVNITVDASPDKYTLSKTSLGNGSIGTGGEMNHGDIVEIIVSAEENNYIASFKINGEEISFSSTNWQETSYNNSIKKYNYGIYSFVASENVIVETIFAVNSYEVIIDSTSIGGSTTLSVDGRGVVSRAFHGDYLNIAMAASTGYHITAIFINNERVTDYVLKSDTPNANTTDAYIYMGKKVGIEYSGITERTIVRVVYEINRYSFTFKLTNASENFAADTGAGSLTSIGYTLEGNAYKGIEHGTNFSIDLNPTLGNGYYVYSVYIKYKSATSGESEEVTRYHYDAEGIVNSRGGTIWFNRFMGFEEGVTANIELIDITFKRSMYAMDLTLISQEGTGTMDIEYANRTNIGSDIIMLSNLGERYYYRPDKKIYRLEGGIYVLTNIELVYDAVSGKYIYIDGASQVVLLVEHGVQYKALVRPTVGYQRTEFLVNNEDRNSLVFDNEYSVNITRNTSISVEYTIITYMVNYSTTVIDKNLTGRISNALIKNYMDISIKNLTTNTTSTLPFGVDKINISVNYGARLQFVSLAKFDTTGYYLYSIYVNNVQVSNFGGSAEGEAIYGGANYNDGLMVTEDLAIRVSFRIKRYAVTTSIRYQENILNESSNIVREESSDTIPWGDAAYIKVATGVGYNLDDITVKRGVALPTYVLLDPSPDIINNLLEQMHYNAVNQYTNERRDVLKVVEVESDISVVVYLSRKEFTLRYVINNVQNLNKIETTLNAYNATYPTYNETSKISTGTWESGNINIINVKYYDEIAAIITPNNGYNIKELLVTVRAIRWDSDLYEWVAVLDNQDNPIVYTINYTETYNDSRSFTFHNPNSPIAMHNVKTDLEITFTMIVKTYTINNSIVRANAFAKINETNITMSVKDAFGENIILEDESYQYSQVLTRTNKGKILIAEHHGYILYNFDVANGFMLKSLGLNGFIWDNFNRASLSNSFFTYSAVQNTDSYGFPYYSYSIRVPITNALIAGEENFFKMNYDIEFSMEIVPITYQVRVFINGENYQITTIGGAVGATDSATLVTYVNYTIDHFAALGIRPAPLEGYKVTALSMRVGTTLEALSDASYNTSNPGGEKSYPVNSSFLADSSVIEDKLTIYIYYTAVIKTYQVNIGAYAHSNDTSLVGEGNTEGFVALNTSAGTVAVTPTTKEGAALTYNGVALYEYFVNVRYEATATEEYAIYLIEEYVWVKQNNQGEDVYEWVTINNGVRGLSYHIVMEGGVRKHIVNYMVDDYGNRQFRVIYKQKTTVTVYVTNPYKYRSGTIAVGMMTYNYYSTVKAKENGADIVSSLQKPAGQIVVDTYVYNVYVGNYISLSFEDNYYNTVQSGYEFRTKQGENYVTDNAVTGSGGKLITGNLEYYLYTKVYSRVTFEKENNSANQARDGGTVVFNNGSEPTNYSIYSAATVTGNALKITVRPNANYIFTAMLVRQIDVQESKRQGKIVYLTGAEEWLKYDPSTFAEQDTNKFNITMTTEQNTGYVNYHVVMRGDMELRFVFYRVFEIEYTANFTDKTAINGGNLTYYNPKNTYEYITYSEEFDNVATNASETYQVSYDTTFKLSAAPEPENYIFVGWYVNGVNTYEHLADVLPGNDYTVNYFYINIDYMGGLMINNNEVTKLTFMAMYQPVLTVGFINELYYYNNSNNHWNSWQSGSLDASAYNFDGTFVPEGQTNNKIINTSYNTVASTKSNFDSKLPESVSTANWQMFAGVPESNNVYSKIEVIKLLYQNILDYEFVKNSWVNSKIILNMTALSTTVHFTNWQYYNWNSGKYEDISYSYTDASYGYDGEGNPVNVTCFFEYYRFDLNYLYTGKMPYATCSDSATNSNNTLPLIIRPNLWKSVSVDITKSAYNNYLGGTLAKNFSSLIMPKIDTNSILNSTELHTSTSDDGLSGEYDYAATIKVLYYSNVDNNGNVLDYTPSGIKYRFLGWFLNWEVSNQIDFRMVSDSTSMAGYSIDLIYAFGDEPPNDSFELRATYVTQFKQSMFSYNIAGGPNYSSANAGGKFSVKDAPMINTSTNLKTVYFAKYNIATGVVSSVGKTENITDITNQSFVKEFYIDIGALYNIILDFTARGNAESLYAVSGSGYTTRFGYDPNYDKQYKIIKDNVDTGTEVTYTGEQKTANSVFKLDVQYYTKAKLVFNNIMYKAGILVPSAIANNLRQDAIALTVWDMDKENYGDGKTSADGSVSMYIKLQNSGIDYHGNFDYAPYGFKNGYGIKAAKNLVYKYYDLAGYLQSSESMLFNPSNISYRKSITIDYNDGYLVGGSMIFGNPSWPTSSTKYTVANVGDGTEYAPYKIYNAAQMQNLGIFFNSNNYSCTNDALEKVYFQLFDNVKLQNNTISGAGGSATPYGNSKAWVPICYYYDSQNRNHKGFDGVFSGDGYSLYGLAADGKINLTKISDTNNPLANFDYTNLAGYGIFGCINGGTVVKLNLGNAYINMVDFSSADAAGVVSYVGILAARIYSAQINEITFNENAQVVRYSSGSIGTSRVYINAGSSLGLGLLAGYVEETDIDDINVVSNFNDIAIELLGGTTATSATGGIIGQYKGGIAKEYSVGSLKMTISGSGRVLINYDEQAYTNSGGLIGFVDGGQAAISDSVIALSDTAKLYIGSNSSINVGGVIGRMSGKDIALTNSILTSNGTVNTSDTSNIKAEYESKSNFKEKGIFLTASASADVSGDGMGTSGNSTYGKAGALVGLNQSGLIKNSVSSYDIRGGVYFYAGTAGGIVGVNSGGLVQDFALFTKNSHSSTFKMYFRSTFGSASNYGGIAGANVNLGVIDNCSYINNEATKTSGSTDLGGTYMYVFRKDYLTDTDYRNVQAHNNAPVSSKQNKVRPNHLSVGGIVGYNTSGVYNSFIKRSRITLNYYNGAAKADYDWIVRTGGIVGYHNALASDKGPYYGNGSSQYPSNISFIRRVQSCYTVGMSIVILGHIWMDDNSEISGQSYALTGKTAATIGGIVGATNDVIIGQYAISNCYTLNNNYMLEISAWGKTNKNETPGDSSVGWYFRKSGQDIYSANRRGFNLDGNIFGICSGYDFEGGGGSFANYCWTQGNDATNRLTTISTTDGILEQKIGLFENPNLTNKRGISFTLSNDYDDILSYFAPAWDYIGKTLAVFSAMPHPTMTEVEVGSTTIYPGKGGAHGNQPLYVGGFVGVVGGWDGRVYKTDPATGLLLVWHTEADIGSASTVIFGEATDVYEGNTSLNYYNHYYLNSSILSSYYLVRGQLMGTSNRLNASNYNGFETNYNL